MGNNPEKSSHYNIFGNGISAGQEQRFPGVVQDSWEDTRKKRKKSNGRPEVNTITFTEPSQVKAQTSITQDNIPSEKVLVNI